MLHPFFSPTELWLRPVIMFNHEKYITSGNDLKTLFQSCKMCYKTTNNGSLIFFYDELQDLRLPDQRKLSIIINTNSQHHDETNSTNHLNLGHWIVLVIDKTLRKALLYDSLDIITKHYSEILTAIKFFCVKNHFTFQTIHAPTQSPDSLNCGYLVAYFVHLYHRSSLDQFKRFCLLYKRNKITTSEKHIMKTIPTIFHLL